MGTNYQFSYQLTTYQFSYWLLMNWLLIQLQNQIPTDWSPVWLPIDWLTISLLNQITIDVLLTAYWIEYLLINYQFCNKLPIQFMITN